MFNKGGIFIGSVIVPVDSDRNEYINKCYETGTCALFITDMGIIPRVHIGLSIINLIKFPKTSDEFGSMVVCTKTPRHNTYVGFDIIKKVNDFNSLGEDKYQIGESGATIMGDPDNGSIVISAKSNDGGTFSVVVSGDGSSLNALVDGSISFEGNTIEMVSHDQIKILIPNKKSNDKTTIVYTKGVGLEYSDEFGNEISVKEGVIDIKSNKINFGDGSEPLILGDKMKDLLSDIIDKMIEIGTALVPVSQGGYPATSVVEITSFKARLQSLLSNKTKTD